MPPSVPTRRSSALDTPGFIANRIGTLWLQCAVVETLERGLTVEEADAVMGRPLGIPKTGVFALLDLVGLDLMPKVDASLAKTLPPDDAYQALRRPFPLLEKLIAEGYTGRSEEHTSELQSLMRISYAVFCLKQKTNNITTHIITTTSHYN